MLPILISGMIAASVRTAAVPAYFELIDRRGKGVARRFLGAVLTWSMIAAVVGAAVVALRPEIAIGLAGPGLSADARVQGAAYVPLLVPILAFGVMTHILSAIFQIGDRFRPIALALIVAPSVSMLFTIGAWERLGLSAVAIGMTLGHGLSVTLLFVLAARAGMLPPLALRTHDAEIGGFVRHALPLTVGSAVLQFNVLADRAVATLLAVGSASVLRFGQQLVIEPLGSLASAWTTVLYPSLVRTGQGGSDRSLGSAAEMALRYGIAIFVPISVGVAALAPLIVDLVYRRGAFDATAAAATSQVVVAFAPMLTLAMLQPVLTGSHNARRHGVLLSMTAVLNAISNVALNVLLGRWLGVAGIALSTSITVAILIAWLARSLTRSEPDFVGRMILGTLARTLIASAIPGGVVAMIAWGLHPTVGWPANLGLLVGLGIAGLVGYLGLAAVVGLEEPRIAGRRAMNLASTRFGKRVGQ